MTSQEWTRAKELFSAAVALAEAERDSFLQSQTVSDSILEEVRALLAAYEESPDFLDEDDSRLHLLTPALRRHIEELELHGFEALLDHETDHETAGCASPSMTNGTNSRVEDFDESRLVEHESPPEHIGPYKIVRRLGEGGMGIAYLAERDDGVYRHQVAIKVLKDSSQAPGLITRFQNERQVLAGLDHPFIARLIDGGTTTITGRPYYVMEYVPGESLSVYANSHSLGLRERLALFLAVCEAVAAAHRQLVIHGDIKPANILVSTDGSPKLLDFGLARIIRPAASDLTMSMVLLTPGYASPEQVCGARLTTATDIYSLGVLLFELLTGESPYGGVTSSPLELCRAICDDAPRKPSTAAHTAIAGLAPRQLRGDLDHIVSKTLRKSPSERYGTVDQLHADIQRYLDGFPVEAARGSVLYHLRKFVVRRRLLVAFGALLLVLASFAIWRIWRAEQMAELRFNQLRQFAHAMVFDVHDSIKELPGSTAARKMLIERSLQYLKGLETTSGQNRDLKLELARTYTKIGTVQASSASSSLEDCAAGIQNLEHARSLLRDILLLSSTDEEAALALVDADTEAANVHALRGEMSEWRSLRSEATYLLNRVAARHPEKDSLRLRALTSVSNTLDGEHNPAAALKAYETVLDAASHAPSDPDTRLLQARTERNIAEELQALGDMRAALDHQHAALRIFQALLATSPGNTRFRLETSWAYTETGCVEHDFHDERGALADFDRAMQLLRDMAAADPRNQLARLEIGKLEMVAASTVELVVSPKRAAENYRDALSIFAEALKLDSTNDDVRINMAQGEFYYGDLQVRMAHGQCSAGIDSYRRSMETASAVQDDYPATSVFDMRKLREELQRRLAACGSASAL